MTVQEALNRVWAWEREHGRTAEAALACLEHGGADEGPPLREDLLREGAELWLDYEEARRNEEIQRRLARAERTEAFGDFLRRHAH